jgi:cellulose synthase/poly-beta-1,6-N-acetylglucosamine synthase-like glycosyltransferase
MAEDLEMFNAHQEDVRRRADFLAKSIFILSGGTLTVSIGIFSGSHAPALSCILKASWWGLFLAIIFLALTLITIIARDYAFGERWRKKINGQNIDVSGNPTFVEKVIWVLAIICTLAFLAGILGQAYVASNVI